MKAYRSFRSPLRDDLTPKHRAKQGIGEFQQISPILPDTTRCFERVPEPMISSGTLRCLVAHKILGGKSQMEATTSEGEQKSGLLPEFVIGITGHRDIADDEAAGLRDDLRNELSKIAAALPNIPVRIATGLAEGADTIATEIALEMGINVLAVLPMPRNEYRQDFSGDALAKLDDLLADPRISVTEIPFIEGDAAAQSDQDLRDGQYSLLADYLVRRSNLMFAIWDGEKNGLRGGTSDVVMRYLGDGREANPNPISNEGRTAESCGNIVAWIPTRRKSTQSAVDQDQPVFLISNANYDCYWISASVPEPILTRWTGFDGFYVERVSDQGRLLPGYGLDDLSEGLDSPELSGLNAEFIRADQIARFYQTRSHLMFALFGLLAAGMGLAFLVYAKLLADKNLLIIYVGLFVAGFVGFRYTHRLHLHARHLAYRVLAETFRVQYFLILSGAGETYNPRRILGLTSVDQFQRFEWLQEAIRVCEPVCYFGHHPRDKILETVSQGWITDQLKYFEKKRHLLHSQHHRLENIKFALLVGSVVGALSLIFFKKSLIHLDMMGYDGKAWLVFFMGLLPLWAAVWELYQGKMATRELLWQYANQTKYFRAASYEIRQVSNLKDGQKIVRDLADKALVEIYMWSVHRFHREHEPPAAG